MKLLVGSIFTKPDHSWLDLQLAYLNRTTYDFDYICLLTQAPPDEAFNNKVDCLWMDEPHKEKDQHEHCLALNKLTEFFREQTEYTHFLYLDMDAFPLYRWQKTLMERMGTQYEIACLLRSENLEQRLHASVLFAKREALEHLEFKVGVACNDLLGRPEIDVHMPIYQGPRRDKAFPLLRSNTLQCHRILYGVYYQMFYHHGCGSGRNYNMRAKDYWSHWDEPEQAVSDPYRILRALPVPQFDGTEQEIPQNIVEPMPAQRRIIAPVRRC